MDVAVLTWLLLHVEGLTTVTQLGGISLCESSFLGVHLAQGVTFWVSTHAPKALVTRFESVSTFLSYPAPGYP